LFYEFLLLTLARSAQNERVYTVRPTLTPTPGLVAQARNCQNYSPRAPQEHIHGRTIKLSQRQLIRTTRSESSKFIDLAFSEQCVRRKAARERRGGGMIRSHICLPTTEPVQGWCCKAQRTCCSRVNTKHETVGNPMSPPPGPFLPCGPDVGCPIWQDSVQVVVQYNRAERTCKYTAMVNPVIVQ
jgi:hypothetical protein